MAFGARIPVLGSGLTNGLWLAFIAWFFNCASAQGDQRVVIEEILEGVSVKRMMRRDPPTVSPEVFVGDLVHDRVMGPDDRAFPVLSEEGVVGMVPLEDVRSVPREVWDGSWVRGTMTPVGELTAVRAAEDAARPTNRLSDRDVRLLPALSKGTLVGVLRRREVIKWRRLPDRRRILFGELPPRLGGRSLGAAEVLERPTRPMILMVL